MAELIEDRLRWCFIKVIRGEYNKIRKIIEIKEN